MRTKVTSLNPAELYPAVEFDPEMAAEIVGKIYEGKTISSILQTIPAAPTYSTFMKWRREYPEYNQAVVWARQAVADQQVEDILEIADNTLHEPEAYPAANAKVAIDAKKWVASKFNPRTYGDRLALEGEVTLSARLAELGDKDLDQAIKELQDGIIDL